MDDMTINSIVNRYVRDHVSPKPEQREYITEKYGELKGFLGGVCFRSGSYARYTAIDPVHDLDVIYPVTDLTVRDNPTTLLSKLRAQLELQYKGSPTKIKRIYNQTHSVTIELADSPEGDFSIDVVPAIELSEKNEFGQPNYLVPEIQRLNHRNRQRRYEKAAEQPIGWIKSDPRGYVKAASNLNDANSDFRHAAKLLKGWRHACKITHEDGFRLKSFHIEQIVQHYFEANLTCSTVEAVIACLEELPNYLDQAQIPDRADSGRLIDEYVDELNDSERQLILKLQSAALDIASKIPSCDTEAAVIQNLESLLTIRKPAIPPAARTVTPQQPWSY